MLPKNRSVAVGLCHGPDAGQHVGDVRRGPNALGDVASSVVGLQEVAPILDVDLDPRIVERMFAGVRVDQVRHFEYRGRDIDDVDVLETLRLNQSERRGAGPATDHQRLFRIRLEGDRPEYVEALVATAVGLLVAIPAVVLYNAFNRWVKGRLGRAESLAGHVLATLHKDN